MLGRWELETAGCSAVGVAYPCPTDMGLACGESPRTRGPRLEGLFPEVDRESSGRPGLSFHPSLGPNPVITGSVLRMWRMNPGLEVYGFFFPP